MAGYDVTPPPKRLADRVQLRTAFSTSSGDVTKFLVQLEYWHNGAWQEVVRYDHDRDATGGHDVSSEGLHRDEFRDGEKFRTVRVLERIAPKAAFEYAEEDLSENLELYTQRFEEWHDVKEGENR